ncbi:hypothetical protein C8J56DRAFT_333080 [Mycena floridula]|nr:hypothetical protein C8J56DRAFT_333080 [Mycena floridula]
MRAIVILYALTCLPGWSRHCPTDVRGLAHRRWTRTASGALLRSRPDASLKRAHFILPSTSVICRISSANPPSYPGLRRRSGGEERERRRRRRVLTSTSPGSHTPSASLSSRGGYTPTSASRPASVAAGQSNSGREAGAGVPNQAPIPNSGTATPNSLAEICEDDGPI